MKSLVNSELIQNALLLVMTSLISIVAIQTEFKGVAIQKKIKSNNYATNNTALNFVFLLITMT